MWHDMNPYDWLNKLHNVYIVAIVNTDVALELKHIVETSLITVHFQSCSFHFNSYLKQL